MIVADYIAETLMRLGVTDAFGIPGGVILPFLDAMKKKEPHLTPHLTYHEQTAGFAALGYAQISGKLGVAYATRGPGISNMITCVAEAYQESLPVLFITAHGNRQNHGMRFENNQELNIVHMVSAITKYAADIDNIDDVVTIFLTACRKAIEGRKGPVLVDIDSTLWEKELCENIAVYDEVYSCEDDKADAAKMAVQAIEETISQAKRPIILIGNGLRHTVSKKTLYDVVESIKIPVLSSRGSQDLISGSPYYFGYIGSHGIRYSNFILSKTDLIISIGNRLAFQPDTS
jgi:acetolactate synthase-1/2/3 large subunit